MSNVVDILNGQNRIVGEGYEVGADRVLQKAVGLLDETIIIGIDKEGEVYFAATHGRMSEINLLLDRIKHFILTGEFK